MDGTFLYLALGGAILVTLICGVRLMRKYPRIRHPRDDDPNLYAVATRAWETGKPVIGTVDEAGNLTIRDVEPSNSIKG